MLALLTGINLYTSLLENGLHPSKLPGRSQKPHEVGGC